MSGVLRPNKFLVTGSNTAEQDTRWVKETLLARAVRTADAETALLTVPSGVLGARFWLNLYGVTGTFAAGEGIRLRTQHWNTAGTGGQRVLFQLRTNPQTDVRPHAAMWYPTSLGLGDATIVSTGEGVFSSMPFTAGKAALEITGTFGAGEGFDSDLIVEWLV